MRIDRLRAFGLDPKVIAILKGKYGELLLSIQEGTLLTSDRCDTGKIKNFPKITFISQKIVIAP